MNDYFERQAKLDHVISIILEEYGAVTMVLAEGRTPRDLYHIFDETDKVIEKFLPDKTLVKWTIMNMLRDYRSSDQGSGSFEEKLVRHARFYMKVVVHMRYTVQDEELSFTERHGWKLAYDFQLKTRQHLNVRMLILTLNALDKCLSDLGEKDMHDIDCVIHAIDIPESFVKIEGFITDLNSILSDLHNERNYLTMSFGILRSIHQRIKEMSESSDSAFKRMYDDSQKESGSITTDHPSTLQPFNSSTHSNLNTVDTTLEPNTVSNTLMQSDVSFHRTNNTTESDVKTTTLIGTGTVDTNESYTQSTISTVGNEQISSAPNIISDFINLFQELDNELDENIKVNVGLQTQRNRQTLKRSIVGFSSVFLSLFLVMSLTALFVSILRAESELVVCVGDTLKQLTNDVNIQRDRLNAITKKVKFV